MSEIFSPDTNEVDYLYVDSVECTNLVVKL